MLLVSPAVETTRGFASTQNLKRFMQRVREHTWRNRGLVAGQVIARLNAYTRGWGEGYQHAEGAAGFRSIDYWMGRRIRAIIWKHWKNRRTRICCDALDPRWRHPFSLLRFFPSDLKMDKIRPLSQRGFNLVCKAGSVLFLWDISGLTIL